MKLAPHWKGPYRVLTVLGSQGDPGLMYRIGCPLDSDGAEQIVHYNRLKPYTLPLPPGSFSGSTSSPVPSQLDNGLVHGDWVAEELLMASGVRADPATASGGPPPHLSRFGRAVKPELCFCVDATQGGLRIHYVLADPPCVVRKGLTCTSQKS